MDSSLQYLQCNRLERSSRFQTKENRKLKERFNAEENKKPDDMEEIEEVDDDELVDIDDSSDSDFREGRQKRKTKLDVMVPVSRYTRPVSQTEGHDGCLCC